MTSANAPNTKYPEVLLDLVDKLSAMFIDERIAADRAPELAFKVTELLRRELGGQSLYFPVGSSYRVQQMARDIFRRWNSNNTRDLCREYGVSERRLRQLSNIGKALAIAESQLQLEIDDIPH
jgi:Mor family transcriptional regulator